MYQAKTVDDPPLIDAGRVDIRLGKVKPDFRAPSDPSIP